MPGRRPCFGVDPPIYRRRGRVAAGDILPRDPVWCRVAALRLSFPPHLAACSLARPAAALPGAAGRGLVVALMVVAVMIPAVISRCPYPGVHIPVSISRHPILMASDARLRHPIRFGSRNNLHSAARRPLAGLAWTSRGLAASPVEILVETPPFGAPPNSPRATPRLISHARFRVPADCFTPRGAAYIIAPGVDQQRDGAQTSRIGCLIFCNFTVSCRMSKSCT